MILKGQIFSKANSRRMVFNRKTGRMMFIKSKPALEAVKSFTAQAKAQWQGPPLEGPVLLVAHIWYPSRRQDLDPSLLLDILQGIAYENDRQIERMALSKGIDRDNPRVEVKIERLEGIIARLKADHPGLALMKAEKALKSLEGTGTGRRWRR